MLYESGSSYYTKLFYMSFLLLGLMVLLPVQASCLPKQNEPSAAPTDKTFRTSGTTHHLSIDVKKTEGPLSPLYHPSIDLTGHGHPRPFADPQIIEYFSSDFRMNDMYRVRLFYHLLERGMHRREDYLALIKRIQNQGGQVIVTLFGMPDSISSCTTNCDYWNEETKRNAVAPRNWSDWQSLVYKTMKYFDVDNHCSNIWYEVWNEPDLGYWQGTEQEYFLMYKYSVFAARKIKEDHGVSVKIGGPVLSQWNHDINANPLPLNENALKKGVMYRFIRYCHEEKLPIDFVPWHQYSTTLGILERTRAVPLTRKWLKEFGFDPRTPLVLSEWNTWHESDGAVRASFIPAFMKDMEKAGMDEHTFFCIQDYFKSVEEVRGDLGMLTVYGIRKPAYHVFTSLEKMKGGERVQVSGLNDPFADALAVKKGDSFYVLLWNHPPINAKMATYTLLQKQNITEDSLRAKGLSRKEVTDYVTRGVAPAELGKLDSQTRQALDDASSYYRASTQRKTRSFSLEVSIKGLNQEPYEATTFVIDEDNANAFRHKEPINSQMVKSKIDSFKRFLLERGVAPDKVDRAARLAGDKRQFREAARKNLSKSEQKTLMKLYEDYKGTFDPAVFEQARKINRQEAVLYEPVRKSRIEKQKDVKFLVNLEPYSVHFLQITPIEE